MPKVGLPGSTARRRTELAAFLRARRERLRPADAGLPDDGGASGQRRTPGLRREEVAELSGVSLTWYTWLEQGRGITASAQVVDALARALKLNEDEHRRLRDLAGLTAPERETAGADVLPRLRRLVDAAAPNVASIYDGHFDYLAWNRPYALARHDPDAFPADRRNLVWMMFTDERNCARMVSWESAARAVLSQFRAAVGRHPDDPRFAEIVAGLTAASAEFSKWWADYPVRSFKPATIGIDHPSAGRIDFEMFQLRPVEHPDLIMVLQVPVTDADRARLAALLDHSR